MKETGKALDRDARRRDTQAPQDLDVLPWPIWAAFFELYTHMQETYAQVGTTFGQAEEVEMLWDVFLTAVSQKKAPAPRPTSETLSWTPLAKLYDEPEPRLPSLFDPNISPIIPGPNSGD